MMEKYGTDLSQLPVDDDQMRIIKELANKTRSYYSVPKNKKEAEDLIEKMEKIANEHD